MSEIDHHERLSAFFEAWAVKHVTTSLFGAPSRKPLKLWSDNVWVERLKRTSSRPFVCFSRGFARKWAQWGSIMRRKGIKPVATTERYQDGAGKTRFKGAAGLKAIEEYSTSFGRTVLASVTTHNTQNTHVDSSTA